MNLNVLQLALAVITAVAYADLFYTTNGPGDLFLRVFEWLEKRRKENRVANFLVNLLSCPRCHSVWLAPMFYLLLFTPVGGYVSAALIAGLVAKYIIAD